MEEVRIMPARRGAAAFVLRGQVVKVVDARGEQVFDPDSRQGGHAA